MKKILIGLMASLMVFGMGSMLACTNDKPADSIPVENNGSSDTGVPEVSITLSKTELALSVGAKETVTAAVTGTTDAVVWTTSDKAIATVENGVITAVKAGEATITASVGEEKATVTVSIKDVVTFNVSNKVVALNTATYTHPEDGSLGETTKKITYEITVNGASVSDAEITYSSAKPSIATVDATGLITATGEGKTVVTATYTHNGEKYEQKIEVNVTKLIVSSGVRYTFGGDKNAWVIDVSKLGFTPTDIYAIYRADGDDFVQVDENYEIVFDGNCAKVITEGIDIESKTEPDLVIVETESMKYEIDVVYVTKNNVEFVSEVSPMLIGGTKQLKLYVFGEEVDTEDPVEWSVNKSQIATIDQTGKITAVNYGTAVITATVYGYTYTTTQVVHKSTTITADRISVDGIMSNSQAHVDTRGIYEPGEWVSFNFTPAADIESGMLYIYYGFYRNAEHPNGAWSVCAGAKNFTANHYSDSTFVLLDSKGNKLGSLADREGFGKLNANETYTAFIQVPDDGTKDHCFYFYFSQKEVELTEAQVEAGEWTCINILGSSIPVEITVGDYKGYLYNGETRDEVYSKQDVYQFNAAELSVNNKVDVSAWGITQEILIAKIEGFDHEIFVCDENGKPVVEEGKLTLKDDFFTFAGTSGQQVLALETADYKYTATIEITPTDVRFNDVTYIEANTPDYTTIVYSQDIVNNIVAGDKYLKFDFYYYGDVSDSAMLKVIMGGRHIRVMSDKILIESLTNTWMGNDYDPWNIKSNFGWVVDENGQVVNDTICDGHGNALHGSVNNTLVKGKWYTLVLDMSQKYFSDDYILSWNDYIGVMGINTNAYIKNVSFMHQADLAGILLDRTEAELAINETLTLTPTVGDAWKEEEIVWSSSADEIATVNSEGVVTARKTGTVVITAMVGDREATCTITVSTSTKYDIDSSTMSTYCQAPTDDASIKFNTLLGNDDISKLHSITFSIRFKGDVSNMGFEARAKYDDEWDLTYRFTNRDDDGCADKFPAEDSYSFETWSPENARYVYYCFNKSGTLSYIDRYPGNMKLTVEGIAANDNVGKYIEKDTWYKVTYVVRTDIADYNTLRLVFTDYVGDVEIMNVVGEYNEAKISLDKEQENLMPNEKVTLKATTENTADPVVWSSSDDAVASVDENGVVTAHKVGTAVITATVEGKTATCTITVSAEAYYTTYSINSSVMSTYCQAPADDASNIKFNTLLGSDDISNLVSITFSIRFTGDVTNMGFEARGQYADEEYLVYRFSNKDGDSRADKFPAEGSYSFETTVPSNARYTYYYFGTNGKLNYLDNYPANLKLSVEGIDVSNNIGKYIEKDVWYTVTYVVRTDIADYNTLRLVFTDYVGDVQITNVTSTTK